MSFLLIFPLGALVAVGALWGASALLGDAPDTAADPRSPAPLRGLMAPTGTAVILPAFVTTPNGEVQPRWPWDADGSNAAPQDSRRAA
jgi:hypothetical protein